MSAALVQHGRRGGKGLVGSGIMSRFAPEWLALREPVDIESHNKDVLNACARAFVGRKKLSVCDLGAGTGASVRAFAPLLPKEQLWTLVDHDEENLNTALKALAVWSGTASRLASEIALERAGQHIDVHIRQHDLATDPGRWLNEANLATASALFDLTSADWIVRFVDALCAKRIPLLAVLSFDGWMEANPNHELDEQIFSAFRAHQRVDKGFGPAAGPGAITILEGALSDVGYTVISGDSPWELSETTQRLMQETLKSLAAAAVEVGTVTKSEAGNWLEDRMTNTDLLTIGHRDIFAVP